ncbi:hypothetical protein E2562_001078 [Oryza meyeriana var. granulata]|uniref:Flavin-containing monooxygenase n=1 Tax=Oryza meyeriana var. granulata TaxID=110450 RepID=A0A6G1ED10_9ORYZ|nr:hypothetical protein E2562_001078 [Oryza meyeriana var. granulata]
MPSTEGEAASEDEDAVRTPWAATSASLYASLRTNLPREVMGFLDFPFAATGVGGGADDDPCRFPGHEEVLRYMEAFARQFDLYGLVRFETEVVRVRREDGGGGRWAVMSRKLGVKGKPKCDDNHSSSNSTHLKTCQSYGE